MSCKRSFIIGLALGLCVSVAASSAWADCSWKSPASATFGSISSWTQGHYPTSSEGATFNLGSLGYTVTFDNNYTNTFASIQNDNVTFNLAGFRYTQTNSTDGLVVGKSGGSAAIGYLTLTGGYMTSASVKIGADAQSSGTVLVNSTAAWSVGSSGGVYVGYAGRGVLAIQGGSITDSSALLVGEQMGAWGTVTVDGTTASCLMGTLYLGDTGSGELFVRSGGLVSCSTGILSANPGAYGAATVDGAGSSLVASFAFKVGDSGTGTVAITGGGRVSSDTGVVGGYAGSQGSVRIDGVGSVWTARTNSGSAALVVGNIGSGEVTVSGGGLLTCNAAEIGQDARGCGSITVRDAGSAWNANAGLVCGDYGTGYLTITGGGRVTSGTGTTAIGFQQGSFGSVTVDGTGSSWTSTNPSVFTVGGMGTGGLSITGGGRVSIGSSGPGAIIGDAVAGSGNVTVGGAGSLWTVSGPLVVGNNGTGYLTISNGGRVTSGMGPTGIGLQQGSFGSVTVDGAGSSWTSTDANGLTVGGSGTGSLTITGGGRVTCTIGNMGWSTDASPRATVRGIGSAWVMSGDLYFDDGPGTLTIDQGGAVSCNCARLSVSGASVSVADRGSTWKVSNWLSLSNNSSSQAGPWLTVSGGGAVTIGGTFYVYPNSTFTLNGGTVSANTLLLVDKGALCTVTDGSLSLAQDVQNYAEFRLGGPSARITTPVFFNSGLLRGTGRIEGQLFNENNATITVTGSDRLTVAGPNADLQNNGTVNLVSGGTVESLRGITSYGTIAGQGTLSTGAGYHLDNAGSIAFSTGLSNVFGDVLNDAGGSIIVSGGGAATFYGPVTHNGTQFKVSEGSTATFLGPVNGKGDFTGTGTTYFEAGYSPGSSPAAVTFEGNMVLTSTSSLHIELGGTTPGKQYDTVSVGHGCTLGGTLDLELINGFRPSHNDAFQVLSWGTRSGAFGSITGLDLGSRLRLVPVWNSNDLTLKAVQGGDGTWGVDAPGVASLADNWIGGLPNGVGDRATFGAAIHAPRQVTVDAPTVLGALVFASGPAYTIAGPCTLTLQADTGHATIDASATDGSVRHVISAPVALASALDITTAADTTIRFEGALSDAAGLTVTKFGDGTLELAGPQTWGAGSLLDVLGGTVNLATDAGSDTAYLSIGVSGATVNFDANQHLDRLIIGDGGKVVLRHAGLVVIDDLQMGGFDLGHTVLTPEPATAALLLIGAVVCLRRKRRL